MWNNCNCSGFCIYLFIFPFINEWAQFWLYESQGEQRLKTPRHTDKTQLSADIKPYSNCLCWQNFSVQSLGRNNWVKMLIKKSLIISELFIKCWILFDRTGGYFQTWLSWLFPAGPCSNLPSRADCPAKQQDKMGQMINICKGCCFEK